MRFAHPRLLVANFTETFLFYQNIAGLKVIWGDENNCYASFANRDGKKPVLALFARQAMAEAVDVAHLPTDARTQDQVALVFHMDDVDAEANRLKARGIRLVPAPKDFPGWGIRSAYSAIQITIFSSCTVILTAQRGQMGYENGKDL